VRILTVNAGSSSLKLAVFESRGVELIRVARANESVKGDAYLTALTSFLAACPGQIDVVAHRVVHGGQQFARPRIIDAEVEAAIGVLAALAPLHNPSALKGLHAVRQLLGQTVPQVALFDTAFFADLPPAAAVYALPQGVAQRHGIRRFGFHGLAHQGRWRRWQQLGGSDISASRVISLHLGAGCSAVAIAHGKPVDTSMGFSPLEGLVMATRCGDVDPSVLLHLLRSGELSLNQLEHMLNHESGLLGLSGHSADMRALIKSPDEADRLAVDVFVLRVRKYLGAYAAVLGGVDAVLIGGGIGEFQPEVRARIFAGMNWLGLKLDQDTNQRVVNREAFVHASDSAVSLWVIPTDEERAMAEETMELLTK